jgi:hypothetical protein
MKIGATLLFTVLTVAAYSQNSINSYKFVLVPKKFDFFKADDEYGLNTTTKLLLEQKGFVVLWSNGDLPQAVVANKCAALVAEVTQRTTMFTTNLTIQLKDCLGNVVYKSKEGKSREKEYDVAYNEALKDAFSSLNTTTAASPPVPVPAPTSIPISAPGSVPPAVPDIQGTLYAQDIPAGYQLIDTTPRKVLTLLKTSMQDCFLAQTGTGTSDGIVFKRNGEWFFEHYKDGTLLSQKLEIKF